MTLKPKLNDRKFNFNYGLLEYRVKKKFGTLKEFLKAYGRTRTSWFYKTKGEYESNFDSWDIMKLCEILDIPKEDIVRYFFDTEVK